MLREVKLVAAHCGKSTLLRLSSGKLLLDKVGHEDLVLFLYRNFFILFVIFVIFILLFLFLILLLSF